MQTGVQGFLDDMAELGLDPRVEAGLVIFAVIPVDGGLAGSAVETGVSTDELSSWPQVPPHWLHFPSSVKFAKTNPDASPKAGWVKHSRNLNGWGQAPAGREWVSHVRAVLGEAVP